MDKRLHTENAIPNWAVAVLAAIALSTLAGVAIYRATGHGPVSSYELARVVRQVELEFVDRADGTILVRDAASGKELETLAYGEDGFIRSTMRSLARERKLHGLGSETPFELSLRGDGHLTLDDPALDRTIYLRAFGPTNEQAFRRLLKAKYPDLDSVPLIPRLSQKSPPAAPREQAPASNDRG